MCRSTRTSADDLRRELTRQPAAIAFGACSQAGGVHDLRVGLGLVPLVSSATGAAWQWKRVQRKTNRDDALKLAELAAVGELDGVSVPPHEVRQWKSLIWLM